jgi:hypothetical protein
LGLGDTTSRLTPTHLLAPTGYRFSAIESGVSASHVLGTVEAVPEPSSLALMALSGLAMLRRGKRPELIWNRDRPGVLCNSLRISSNGGAGA